MHDPFVYLMVRLICDKNECGRTEVLPKHLMLLVARHYKNTLLRRLIITGGCQVSRLTYYIRYSESMSGWCDLIDYSTGESTQPKSMPLKLCHHKSVAFTSNMILVTGGEVFSRGLTRIHANCYMFDNHPERRQRWFRVTDMKFCRADHSLTLLADGTVMACGGGQRSLEIFDPSKREWNVCPTQMPGYIEGHCACLLLDGRVLIIGGRSGASSGYIYNWCHIFDPADSSIKQVKSMKIRRYWAACVLLFNGNVLVTGGVDISGPPFISGEATSKCEVYDPVADEWHEAPEMGSKRIGHALFMTPIGPIAFGGALHSKTPEILYCGGTDPEDWGWHYLANSCFASDRYHFAASSF